MKFEDILAACISALEEGATVEECLARHRLYAEELAPLLQIVAGLRTGPALYLPDKAFVATRNAVALAARNRQIALGRANSGTQPDSVTARLPHTDARFIPSAQWPGVSGDVGGDDWQETEPNQIEPRFGIGNGSELDGRASRRRSGRFSWPTVAGGTIAACALLISLLLVRSAANSLPGHTLYGVKRVAEQTQGALMMAAGDRAAWHARQAERRLREAVALQQMGMQVSPMLLAEANSQVQSALAASDSLPPAERTEFLTMWLDSLMTLQAGALVAGAPASALRGTMLEVERALDGEPELVVQAPPTRTAPSPTQTATQPAIVLLLPSPTPQAAVQITPQATLQTEPQTEPRTEVARMPTRRATSTPRSRATATPQIALQTEPDSRTDEPTATSLPARDPTPTWTPPRLTLTATPIAPSGPTPTATEMPAIVAIPSLAPDEQTSAVLSGAQEPAPEAMDEVGAASTTMTTMTVSSETIDPETVVTLPVTPTLTMTPTATLTPTLTAALTPTQGLAAETATPLSTSTSTVTSTSTPTLTPTPTVTDTPGSSLPTATEPVVPSPLLTPSWTPSATPLPPTDTPTETSLPTATLPTATPQASDTPAATPTMMPTWTATEPPEPTATETNTSLPPTNTSTATATDEPDPTATPTPTLTPTPKLTATPSAKPTEDDDDDDDDPVDATATPQDLDTSPDD